MNTSKPELRHGRTIAPASRGQVAIDLGLLGAWQVNEMEGGKNFPDVLAGAFPVPYQTDVLSAAPPADGFILSGGDKVNDLARNCVNFTDAEMTEKLGKPFSWPCLSYAAGAEFEVQWAYTAAHKTRGYRWFITKDGWDPMQRITRAQLQEKPFYEDFYPDVPYDQHELKAKTQHSVALPTNKSGHHVVVLVWIVADTGMGFYQAFDIDFV